MTDPAAFPDDRIAAARLAKERSDNAIRARAIQEGRKLEREELITHYGAAVLDDLGMLPQVRAEHAAELARSEQRWEREERKHGRHRFWQGVAAGAFWGATVATVAILLMQGVIWDTAARSFREQAMTGALLSGGSSTVD